MKSKIVLFAFLAICFTACQNDKQKKTALSSSEIIKKFKYLQQKSKCYMVELKTHHKDAAQYAKAEAMYIEYSAVHNSFISKLIIDINTNKNMSFDKQDIKKLDNKYNKFYNVYLDITGIELKSSGAVDLLSNIFVSIINTSISINKDKKDAIVEELRSCTLPELSDI